MGPYTYFHTSCWKPATAGGLSYATLRRHSIYFSAQICVFLSMVDWALCWPGVGRASNSVPDTLCLPGTRVRCEWWHNDCCVCVVESCHDNIKRGWGICSHTSVLIFGKQFAVEMNRSLGRYRVPAYFLVHCSAPSPRRNLNVHSLPPFFRFRDTRVSVPAKKRPKSLITFSAQPAPTPATENGLSIARFIIPCVRFHTLPPPY